MRADQRARATRVRIVKRPPQQHDQREREMLAAVLEGAEQIRNRTGESVTTEFKLTIFQELLAMQHTERR